jgi:hypothetical protein
MKPIIKLNDEQLAAVEEHEERVRLHNEGDNPMFAADANEGTAWTSKKGRSDYVGTIIVKCRITKAETMMWVNVNKVGKKKGKKRLEITLSDFNVDAPVERRQAPPEKPKSSRDHSDGGREKPINDHNKGVSGYDEQEGGQ